MAQANGTLSINGMEQLKNSLASSADFVEPGVGSCKVYTLERQQARQNVTDVLKLVHSDKCNCIVDISIEGIRYYINFIDDKIRRISCSSCVHPKKG